MNAKDRQIGSLMSWMQDALIFPQNVSGQEIELNVKSTSRLSAEQHLAIYQRSYYSRLLKCLREQFPALCYALGKKLFTDFAFEYLQKYPSQSYTLYDLSQKFPAYLEETRPDRDQDEEHKESWINFMVDLTVFERQIMEMFDLPGNEGKPFANENTPDKLLGLQPCFAIGDFRFPVCWYYHQVRNGKEPKYPAIRRSRVAIVRKDYVTNTIELTSAHYTFLKSLIDKKSVKESLEIVAEELAITFEEVQKSWSAPDGIRKHWINAGFFITMEIDVLVHKK